MSTMHMKRNGGEGGWRIAMFYGLFVMYTFFSDVYIFAVGCMWWWNLCIL